MTDKPEEVIITGKDGTSRTFKAKIDPNRTFGEEGASGVAEGEVIAESLERAGLSFSDMGKHASAAETAAYAQSMSDQEREEFLTLTQRGPDLPIHPSLEYQRYRPGSEEFVDAVADRVVERLTPIIETAIERALANQEKE